MLLVRVGVSAHQENSFAYSRSFCFSSPSRLLFRAVAVVPFHPHIRNYRESFVRVPLAFFNDSFFFCIHFNVSTIHYTLLLIAITLRVSVSCSIFNALALRFFFFLFRLYTVALFVTLSLVHRRFIRSTTAVQQTMCNSDGRVTKIRRRSVENVKT